MATSDQSTPAAATPPPAPPVAHAATLPQKHHPLRFVAIAVILIGLIVGGVYLAGSLGTISTDDAYVNGHVTFVAPRVSGQVTTVYVDDNNRVHKGDLLVQIDPEPYRVQLGIAQAAVVAAQADLVAADAQVRAFEGQTRSLRFSLEHAMEDVDNQIATLRVKVATLDSKKAALTKAQADYDRAAELVKTGAVSTEDFDTRTEALLVAKAQVEEALQGVYQVRVALGLPMQPESGADLTQVPADLDQTFSTVRQAQASLAQAAAQIGVSDSFNISPRQMVQNFYARDPEHNIDRIYAKLRDNAPTINQARSKLNEANHNLEQAVLNLRYTQVRAEIDGVVTRRSVNPGNNVIAGQSLMAIRSLTDVWVDANFKETQLSSLRIGQSVDIDADMYGGKVHFKGRVSGITMGTGSTLALLPAENATGNFVKVVQRIPVRIDLLDYDPDKTPLFIGLSVTPTVHIDEQPTGNDAGKVLQPYLPPSTVPALFPATDVSTTMPADIDPATMPASGGAVIVP